MRKNGFTLIELLAVIVILAIIALIATPIILGIINDAREKANERSVELYASAVKNGIAAYQLTGLSAPKSFRDLNIQYDGDVKCTVQELYADGSFYLEGCKVNGSEKTYSYGTKQGTSIEVGTMGICNPISVQVEGAYTAGDKYECDVDPNKEGYDYMFYILNMDSTSVNLIMDSNINISGEAVKSNTMEDKGFVAWINEDDYGTLYPYDDNICWNENGCALNDKGPITAMNYLQTATLGWTNVNPQTISTFTDDTGSTYNIAETYVVNARMPYESEVSNVSNTTLYLIDYLDGNMNSVDGVSAYWLFSFNDFYSMKAWRVICIGDVDDYNYVDYVGNTGVRPVINLSI